MTLLLPAQTLRSLAAALRQLNYVPSSWHGLLAGLGAEGRCQLEPLLVKMVREGAQPRLMALVLDQLADQQEQLQQERDAWSFVWSGPDPRHSRTADTYATVDQLLTQAKRSLLIATYNIGLSDEFRQLLEAIAQRLESGQLERVELFFHPIQLGNNLGSDPLAVIRRWFDAEVWPWPAKPVVHVDARLLEGGRIRAFQHAKVVIADAGSPSARALVTSANFSENAHRHNFEAGWLCKETWRVQQIHDHFQQLIQDGLFVRL